MAELIDTSEATAIIADYFDEICDTDVTFNENEILRRLNKRAVDAEPVIRCKDCKFHCDRTRCKKRIGAWFDDDYCNGAVMAERKEE